MGRCRASAYDINYDIFAQGCSGTGSINWDDFHSTQCHGGTLVVPCGNRSIDHSIQLSAISRSGNVCLFITVFHKGYQVSEGKVRQENGQKGGTKLKKYKGNALASVS